MPRISSLRPVVSTTHPAQLPATVSSTISQSISLSATEERIVQDVLKQALAARPDNTKQTYNRRQLEFMNWCESVGYSGHSAHTVTGLKLMYFLKDAVIGRAHCPTGKRKSTDTHTSVCRRRIENLNSGIQPMSSDTPDNENESTPTQDIEADVLEGSEANGHVADNENLNSIATSVTVTSSKTIGLHSVRAYITAVTDLWTQQTLSGANNHPNPRTAFPAMKMLIETLKREEHELKIQNFEDCGKGTLIDGFSSEEQLQKIANYFWNDKVKGLRNSAMFMLSTFSLLRGDDTRSLELADIHAVELQNKGPQKCFALSFVSGRSKTNQFGRVEIGGALRHRNVGICAISKMAFYFFWRWYVTSESFPDFSMSESWFGLKTFVAGSLKDEMAYKTHNDAVSKMFKTVGITAKAKTHSSRGSGSRLAEINGAGRDDIRALGRWNNSAMEGCYLTNLPRVGMRVAAGFPKDPGYYYLPRAMVNPPDHLMEQIFPQLKEWTKRYDDGINCERTICLGGFLSLLRWFRKVILQDAVFCRDLYPHHSLWSNPIFQSPEFEQFAALLKTSCQTTSNPTSNRLEAIIPDLKLFLDAQYQQIQASISSQFSNMSTAFENFNAGFQMMQTQTNQLQIHLHRCSNQVSVLTNGLTNTLSQLQQISPCGNGPFPDVSQYFLSNPTVSTSTSAQISTPCNANSFSTPPSTLYATTTPTSLNILPVSVISNNYSISAVDAGTTNYKMSRSVQTVAELWKEWKEGLPPTFVALEFLEINQKGSWRTGNNTESRHFGRRIKIIREIERIVASGKSVSVAVAEVEKLRVDTGGTLNQLNNYLVGKK